MRGKIRSLTTQTSSIQIPDAYRYYVDNLVKQARLIVEKGEPLAALAFVGHLESRKVHTIRLDDSSEASISVETVHGHWMATPLLRPKPPSKKRRTFGEVSWAFMPGMSGRFVGLLPRPSTLH
jgi:hypothetical protein